MGRHQAFDVFDAPIWALAQLEVGLNSLGCQRVDACAHPVAVGHQQDVVSGHMQTGFPQKPAWNLSMPANHASRRAAVR